MGCARLEISFLNIMCLLTLVLSVPPLMTKHCPLHPIEATGYVVMLNP